VKSPVQGLARSTVALVVALFAAAGAVLRWIDGQYFGHRWLTTPIALVICLPLLMWTTPLQAAVLFILYVLNILIIGITRWDNPIWMTLRYLIFPLGVALVLQNPNALVFVATAPVIAMVYWTEIPVHDYLAWRAHRDGDEIPNTKPYVEMLLGGIVTGGMYGAVLI